MCYFFALIGYRDESSINSRGPSGDLPNSPLQVCDAQFQLLEGQGGHLRQTSPVCRIALDYITAKRPHG
jgi:hypothetical protein